MNAHGRSYLLQVTFGNRIQQQKRHLMDQFNCMITVSHGKKEVRKKGLYINLLCITVKYNFLSAFADIKRYCIIKSKCLQ